MSAAPAITLAALVAACNGTGDLGHHPATLACFQDSNDYPAARGVFIEAPEGQPAKDTRFVEVTVTNLKGATLSGGTARESTSGATMDVVEQGAVADGYRLVVRVPTRVPQLVAMANASCEVQPKQTINISVVIDDNDAIKVHVY